MFESAHIYHSKNHPSPCIVLSLLFFPSKVQCCFPIYPVWSNDGGLDINSHLLELKWEVIGTQGSVTLEVLCLPTSATPKYLFFTFSLL